MLYNKKEFQPIELRCKERVPNHNTQSEYIQFPLPTYTTRKKFLLKHVKRKKVQRKEAVMTHAQTYTKPSHTCSEGTYFFPPDRQSGISSYSPLQVEFTFSMPTEVDWPRSHMDIHEVVDDPALDVIHYSVHKVTPSDIHNFNIRKIPFTSKQKRFIRFHIVSISIYHNLPTLSLIIKQRGNKQK